MDIYHYKKLFKGKLLYSFPIYFRSKVESEREYTLKLSEYIKEREKSFNNFKTEYTNQEKVKDEIRFNKKMIPWKYNEVIGFLEIIVFENNLYGFLYSIIAKRYSPKIPNKVYNINDQFISNPISITSSNNTDIIKWIKNLPKEIIKVLPKYKNYYFDFSTLNNLSKYINFK